MSLVSPKNDFIYSEKIVGDEFLVLYGILLIPLQIGFLCIEVSRTTLKDQSNVFLKIFLHLVISCFMYWLIGCCLSSSKGNFFLGYTGWNFIATNRTAEMPQWLFDSLVSATPVTILSGVILERCNSITFIIFSVIISGIIHPISVHWIWTNEGWLHQLGYTDFSGAGIVFAFAGIACFVASLMLGPRKSRFSENSETFPIHSAPFLSVGALFTIVGFLVFNCASVYRITANVDKTILSVVIQNTIISASGGSILSLIVSRTRIQQLTWLLNNTVNGSLAGMVAICAGVNLYEGWEAFVVGVIAASIYLVLHYVLLFLKIDDPIDGFPVFFGGGFWGVLASKIFSNNGLLTKSQINDSAWYLLINFTGVMAICLWSIIWSAVSLIIVKTIEKLIEPEDLEAQVNFGLNSYEDDSCYIEALPYPQNISTNNSNNEKDEYLSHFRNSTLRILTMDSNLYENMGLDMELQIR